jgi:hypothetical protein
MLEPSSLFFCAVWKRGRTPFLPPLPTSSSPSSWRRTRRSFEPFGGLTREHLYDRPRTICRPDEQGKRVWNPILRAFDRVHGTTHERRGGKIAADVARSCCTGLPCSGRHKAAPMQLAVLPDK